MAKNNKIEKTQVMRILDQKKIPYEVHTYDENITDGMMIAKILEEDMHRVFKTLVTVGSNHLYYVFAIPVCETLDLKKAAKVSGVKSIEMIKQKDLLPLTGYIHGGCSMIGMKKVFPTWIDESAKNFDKICFSAGKIGYQVDMNLNDLEKVVFIQFSSLISE